MDEQELRKVVGQRIRTARELRDLKQVELAARTGWLTYQRVNNYELAVRLPDRAAIEALAQALDCPPLWLGAYDLLMQPDERALLYKYWATDKRGQETIQSNAGAQPATRAGPWTELLDETG